MKIILITFLIFTMLIAFSMGIDFLMGFEITNFVRHAFSPFIVMEPIEIAVFITIILIVFAKGLLIERQKKKQT